MDSTLELVFHWIEDLPNSPLSFESDSETMESESGSKKGNPNPARKRRMTKKESRLRLGPPEECAETPDNEGTTSPVEHRQSGPNTPIFRQPGPPTPIVPQPGPPTPSKNARFSLQSHTGVKPPGRHVLEYSVPAVNLQQDSEPSSYEPAQTLAEFLNVRSKPQKTDSAQHTSSGQPQIDSEVQIPLPISDLEKLRLEVQRCRSDFESENTWISDVTLPLFQIAISDKPFKLVSVESISLSHSHLPRFYGKAYDKKIDFVLKYPARSERWTSLYKEIRQALGEPGGILNPFDNTYLCSEFLGLGLEVKRFDGEAEEAELQIMTFAAALLHWIHHRGRPGVPIPPVVMCTMVGNVFDFYIAYAEEVDGSIKVTIWGPHVNLRADLETMEGLTRVCRTLRAVTDYLEGTFLDALERKLFQSAEETV